MSVSSRTGVPTTERETTGQSIQPARRTSPKVISGDDKLDAGRGRARKSHLQVTARCSTDAASVTFPWRHRTSVVIIRTARRRSRIHKWATHADPSQIHNRHRFRLHTQTAQCPCSFAIRRPACPLKRGTSAELRPQLTSRFLHLGCILIKSRSISPPPHLTTQVSSISLGDMLLTIFTTDRRCFVFCFLVSGFSESDLLYEVETVP